RNQKIRKCYDNPGRKTCLRRGGARLSRVDRSGRLRGDSVIRHVLFIALAAAAVPASSQEIYDLLLRGGHVIDPKNQRNGPLDIAISGDRIRKIGGSIPAAQARRVVDVSGLYVTPGLIDIHTHFDAQGAPLNLNPDHNALRN